MRVLIVGHSYVVAVNRKKAAALADCAGVEPVLVSPREWPHALQRHRAEPEHDSQVPFHPLPTLFAGCDGRYVYFPSLARLIARIQPDIIQVEEGAPALCYAQALLARRRFAPNAKCLFFTWVNLPYSLGPLGRAVEHFNFRHSDAAIAGSEEARDMLHAHGFAKPVHVIPQLGVDPDLYRRQDATGRRAELGLDAFTLGYAGRFVEEKGLLTLIEALSQISQDCRLLLVGSGPLKDRMTQLARARGVADRLRFVGPVSHAEMPLYLNCMDALILPSLGTPGWKEQFGHVLIEAMACETAVIGSDSGEIPRIVGEAGLLFHEGDAGDLAAKIRILRQDRELRKDLAQRGRRRIEDRYTHHVIAEQHAQVYRSLMATTADSCPGPAHRPGKQRQAPALGFRLLVGLLSLALMATAARLAFTQNYAKRHVADWLFLLRHPLASTDAKLTWQIGRDYRMAKMIQAVTPTNSVILIPSTQSTRAQCANRSWLYYFVWPRYLTCEVDPVSPPVNYVMIIDGAGPSAAALGRDAPAIPSGAWGLYDRKRKVFISMKD